MAEIIPADTHVVGDNGHTTDHDNIADVLTRLAITLAQASAPGATFTTAQGANALAALDTMTSGFWAGATDMLNVRAAPYLAAGNGTTNDTTAITNAITDLNAGKGGGIFFPYGNYLITAPLPTITRSACSVQGQGWTESTGTTGSALTAGAGTWSSPMLTLGGEGITVEGMSVNGNNTASTLYQVSASNCRILNCASHGTAAAGININVVTGGSAVWIDNCRINGINGANTGIQVNDTDAIITNCKPENCAFSFNLLSGASGALVEGNHPTPGASQGQNAIWVQGCSRITIANNRFDNHVRSAIQLSPGTSFQDSVVITGNVFYSTKMADNTYPQIGVDTTSAGVRSLVIAANSANCISTNRPSYFLHAITQAGSAAANPANMAVGTLVTGNICYAATGFYGPSATPTMSRANLLSTTGTTFTAVADI